jgi:hypothetical protein
MVKRTGVLSDPASDAVYGLGKLAESSSKAKSRSLFKPGNWFPSSLLLTIGRF